MNTVQANQFCTVSQEDQHTSSHASKLTEEVVRATEGDAQDEKHPGAIWADDDNLDEEPEAARLFASLCHTLWHASAGR